MKARITAGLVATLLATTASAEDHSVGANIGLLGLGVEYTYRINDLLSARASINGSSYSFDESKSDIDYSLNLDFDSLAVGVDFHPGNKAVRFSVGILSNDNGISARSNPAQSFDIGGTTYSAADVGTLSANIGFDSTAPYASIGWNWMREKSFGVTFDLGVISQGSPHVRLSADGPVLGDPQFADDIAAEELQLEQDLDDFDLYPFARLGFVFRF
ncbi:MAG: hypothetical protein PVF63_04385 [Gammaproteobacteria bacterium]|jgi:hypothetical protein